VKDRCKQLIHTLNQHLTLHPQPKIKPSVNKTG
jgi:hypothetical protein